MARNAVTSKGVINCVISYLNNYPLEPTISSYSVNNQILPVLMCAKYLHIYILTAIDVCPGHHIGNKDKEIIHGSAFPSLRWQQL